MKTEDQKIKRFPRPVKVLLWLAGALVVYAMVGFLVAPAVIKAQMLKRLPPVLHRPVAVAQVKVNPFALSLTIRGLAVNENNGAPFAGWDEFYARLKFASFFQHGWAVDEIYLTHPFAAITRAKDGKLNFDDIAAALNASPSNTPAPAAKSALPLVTIDSLHLDNADVSVEDFVPPTPVKTKFIPIHLKLDNLSTDPKARNPWSFTAKSDAGETFAWNGFFSLEPLQVSGGFQIEGLNLKKYSPYLAPFTSAGITDGKLTVTANYQASLGTNGPDLSLTKGDVLLTSFCVKSSDPAETVFTNASLSVKLVEANLGKRLLHLAFVKTHDGSVLARQNQDGTINLLSLLKVQTNSPPAASQTPWTVMVDEIAVDRYDVSLEDKKPARPARFNLAGISFNATNFSTVSNAPLAVQVSMRLNEAGRLLVNGTVHLQPPAADLAVELIGLDLRPLQPYVEQQAQLAVGGGLLSLSGHAAYNSEKGSPMAAFQGDLSLTNFSTTDLIQFKDFVKLDGLAVSGINAAFQPNRLDVQEVRLSGLSTTVIMLTNHQINLLAVLPKTPAPANPPPPRGAPPGAAALDFPVTLAILVIDKASFHFSDQSIEPVCLFDVQEFNGAIKGLSSQPDSRASVDIQGKMDEVSSFSVTGEVNPLSKDLAVNLAVDCKNVNLTPVTPYMEKFAGYPLEKGKLLLDLHENIARGELLSSNHVTIASLTLGAKNNSPDATSLPVKLGIALLKDRHGNIDLDVPVHGKLSDPDFKVMPIVWQVLRNLLAKAATSPFTLLGSLFGGGEEMSYVDFQPGLADIPASEQAKLDKLAKALFERPAVQVEISAGSDPGSDAPVLARLKLDDQIRSLQAGELIAAGTPAESVQSIQVEPTNYTRLLKTLYLRTIGTNTNTNTAPASVLAPSSTASAGLAAPKPGEGGSAPANVTILPPVEVTARSRSANLHARPFMKGAELLTCSTSLANIAFDNTRPPPPSPSAKMKGAELLMRSTSSANIAFDTTRQPAPSPSAKEPSQATAAQNPNPAAAGPSPAPEPTQDQMEASLIAALQSQISSDDLRALMQARARNVQAALAKSGGPEVAPRLFLLAPAPISPTAKGQTRANLSLQ